MRAVPEDASVPAGGGGTTASFPAGRRGWATEQVALPSGQGVCAGREQRAEASAEAAALPDIYWGEGSLQNRSQVPVGFTRPCPKARAEIGRAHV